MIGLIFSMSQQRTYTATIGSLSGGKVGGKILVWMETIQNISNCVEKGKWIVKGNVRRLVATNPTITTTL